MITSKEYPECPECDGITYPTFDHQTGKTYFKCHSCGYDDRKEKKDLKEKMLKETNSRAREDIILPPCKYNPCEFF